MCISGYKNYCASYNYAGKKWALEISAKSFDDARGHLSHMSYGTVDGAVTVTGWCQLRVASSFLL